MLFKWLQTSSAETMEEYRAAVKKRGQLLLGIAALGLLTLVAAVVMRVVGLQNDFFQGYYIGVGGGLLAAGLGLYWNNRKLLRDEARLRTEKTQEQDERNREIQVQAFAMCARWVAVALYVGMLLAGFWSTTVFWTLFCTFMGGAAILTLCYLWMKKVL